jgi:hypothetical protein
MNDQPIPEQRSEERTPLNRQPDGELRLDFGTRSVRVTEVRDISPQGICVRIASPVTKDETVSVRFRGKSFDLQVQGVVAWANAIAAEKPATGANYVLGINLVSPTLLHTFL